MKTLTLTDFMSKDIVRTGDIAEVVFDYVNDKPIRLLGFKTKANKKDFDIREESFLYFLNLVEQSEQSKYGRHK